MTKKLEEEQPVKLAQAYFNQLQSADNPWRQTDKMEAPDHKEYAEVVKACRFFYRHDPIASSTINKMVELGINEIRFKSNGLSENEMRVFEAIQFELEEFCEALMKEWLISGLIIPEISYTVVPKSKLKELGIKKYENLVLPTSLWLRDPESIEIKSPAFSNEVSYFIKVPDELISFIKNKGKYPDGSADPVLYDKLLVEYPEFVSDVQGGKTKVLLDNDLIMRRNPLADSPYPTPYLYAAIEALKHKRNLRRMDYSIASRVIGAIQLFKLGDKDFPITADNGEEEFNYVKNQMFYRNTQDFERIFQMFANHTLQIEWVYPPTEALLNDKKYAEINQDIIFSLGFPRVLIVGENEKTGTGDNEYAMLSPSRTIENVRKKITFILNRISLKVAELNNFKNAPTIYLKPLSLYDYGTLLKSLADLFSTGNLSATTYADELGYSWDDEVNLREKEKKVLDSKKLDPFPARPFAATPDQDKTKPSDVKEKSNNEDGNN